MDAQTNRAQARDKSAEGQRSTPASFSEGNFMIVMDRQDEFGLPTCDEQTEDRLQAAMDCRHIATPTELRALNFWVYQRVAAVRAIKLEQKRLEEPPKRSALCG